MKNEVIRRTLTAYSFSSERSHLCASRTTEVAPFPMATFSHTPYFFNKLAVVSPPVERPPRSESDFFELPVDRAEDLRTSFCAPNRSLRLNLPLVSECMEEGPLGFEGVSPVLEVRLGVLPLSSRLRGFDGVLGSAVFPPDLPAEKLGGRLAGLLGARLGG